MYGGGGGGGSSSVNGTLPGTGGTGLGGAGGQSGQGAQGGTNRGSGGGGGGYSASFSNGGAGGSGVIFIKVLNTFTATFSGGVTSTLDTTTAPGYNIYRVTATSTGSETVTFS